MVQQVSLPRLGSENVPWRLESGTNSFKPKTFHFELTWYFNERLQDIVLHWLNESKSDVFSVSVQVAHK